MGLCSDGTIVNEPGRIPFIEGPKRASGGDIRCEGLAASARGLNDRRGNALECGVC